MSGWDWVGAVICLIPFVVVLMLKLTFTWLADKDSPYPFSDAEMRKWDVAGKLAAHRPSS